jgi:CRP-like cAMP-binding protein
MSRSTPARTPNGLLARLPGGDRRRLEAVADVVDLDFGDVLVEAGGRLRHAYFPECGLISLLAPPRPAGVLELTMIGREGMLGATLVLGAGTTPLQAVVQARGTALRLSAADLRRQFARAPALHGVVSRYCHDTLLALAQSAPCVHYHAIEARLARWLLMTHDRVQAAPLQLTQAYLGRMLGARRVGVTHAAGALQERGLIEYRRGEIFVVDRRGLESAACPCYVAPHRSDVRPRARAAERRVRHRTEAGPTAH